MGGGTEVLAIADLGQMVITAHVNQVDVEELEAWAPSLVVAVGLASKVRNQ